VLQKAKNVSHLFFLFRSLTFTYDNSTSIGFSTYQTEPDIEDLLSILKSEVNNKKNKNVEVLHLVCNITRRLNGKWIK